MQKLREYFEQTYSYGIDEFATFMYKIVEEASIEKIIYNYKFIGNEYDKQLKQNYKFTIDKCEKIMNSLIFIDFENITLENINKVKEIVDIENISDEELIILMNLGLYNIFHIYEETFISYQNSDNTQEQINNYFELLNALKDNFLLTIYNRLTSFEDENANFILNFINIIIDEIDFDISYIDIEDDN